MKLYLFTIVLYLTGIHAAKVIRNNPILKMVWSSGLHLEGPHWSVKENALYWVDISGQKIQRLDPVTNNVTTISIDYGPVSPVVTVANAPGKLVVGIRTELFLVDFNTTSSDSGLRLITALDLGLPDNRMNDGKVDAKGRLWVGTMGKEVKGNVDPDQAAVYLVTDQNYLNPPVKIKPVSVSNGIAWTKDNKYMFYIDTPTRNIDVFDFDLETAKLRNRRTIFSFAKNNVTGLPDGMTIDTDDNLWVACFNGGMVIKIDSRAGSLLEQHKLPAKKVTSVSWGGPELDVLYVTTSRVDLEPEDLITQPTAGSLFTFESLSAKGFPANEFIFENANYY